MSDPQQPHQPQVPPYAQPQQPASGPYSAQPGYGAPAGQHAQPQGYQLNANSAQPGYPSPSGARSANAPGRLGFVFGLIAVGLGLISTLASTVLIYSYDYSSGYAMIEIANWLGSFIVLAVAGLALGFGIAGLRRPNAPHGQAGIAVGIGIAVIVGSLGSIIINALGHAFIGYF
ncbi:MAG TPA: hypothetical protein VN035_08945 [Microbacterium sp.]|nr:hypothetical protein [Microbacterium sp.]